MTTGSDFESSPRNGKHEFLDSLSIILEDYGTTKRRAEERCIECRKVLASNADAPDLMIQRCKACNKIGLWQDYFITDPD